MVGLPIDDADENGIDIDSSSVLATKAAEVQLRTRMAVLAEQLAATETALENLLASGRSGTSNYNNNNKISSGKSYQPKKATWGETSHETEAESTAKSTAHRWSSNANASNLNAVEAPPVNKRGYLFKWLDRSIGWSGSKWALRFVALDGNHGQISYFGSHLDAQPRYVLSLRDCAVRDDGWKRNQRHKRRTEEPNPPLEEPGAYFFLLSIYQRPGLSNKTNEQDIVPLLRFSTPSMAEKSQWIQLISEACAYCETDQWLTEEAERAAELDKQQRQQSLMTSAMPESKEGTLQPLYFAPHKQQSKHKRRPSFTRTPSAATFRTKSKNADSEQTEKKRLGYPPSKPMHRVCAPSYLSVEAPVQNYRGFFNLGVLMLIVSNIRLLVASVRKHGFVVTAFFDHIKQLSHIQRDPWEEFPFVTGFLLQLVFITNAFCIEWLLSRRRLYSGLGTFLHHANAHIALIVPMWIVWNFIDKPPVGAVLLLHATITWMKLLSYALANEDYRLNESDAENLLALVEDLDPVDADIRYPANITVSNMIYFWFCPSLTYQIAFPKISRRRWLKIGGILMRLLICVTLFTFVAAQIVSPVLSDLVKDLEATGGSYTLGMMADYWLKLAIANTYLWLLFFYGYFHLYLNLFGELLRFGDRVFYRDWWNVLDVGAYWRYVG